MKEKQPDSFQIEGKEYFNGGRLIDPHDGSFAYLAYRRGEQGAFGFKTVREEDLKNDK